MLNKVSKTLTLLVAVLVLFLGTSNFAKAAEWKDGEYSVSFSVLKGDSDSASMADGYFVKPAKLTINNGAILAQISINTSSIKEFKVNGKAVTVLSDNGKSSTVQFAVNSLNTPTTGEIHVVVDGMDYDHWYTVRFDFDSSAVAVKDKETSTSSKSSETTSSTVDAKSSTVQKDTTAATTKSDSNNTGSKIDNPRTGDSMSISLYGSLLLVSTIVMVLMVMGRYKGKTSEK